MHGSDRRGAVCGDMLSVPVENSARNLKQASPKSEATTILPPGSAGRFGPGGLPWRSGPGGAVRKVCEDERRRERYKTLLTEQADGRWVLTCHSG